MALRTPIAPEEESAIDHHYDQELSPLERTGLRGVQDRHKDEIARNLKGEEERAGSASGASGTNENVQEKERQGGDSTWNNKVTPQDQQKEKSLIKGFFKRKNGPAGAIILLLVGGGFGLSVLLSPSLLLVHMSEVITGKMNMQVGSMTERSTKILISQMSSKTTSGACAIVNIRCRYNTMPEKLKSRLEKAGVKVNYQEDKTLLGRYKVTSLEFGTDTIGAGDFKAKMIADPQFRAAIQEGYNPKFAGFADKVWSKVAGNLKISKKAPFDESVNTDEERAAVVEHDTEFGRSTGGVSEGAYTKENGKWVDENGNEIKDAAGNPISDDIANAHNAGLDSISQIEQGADKIAGGSGKASTQILAEAEEAIADVAGNGSLDKVNALLNVAAIPDFACSMYGAIQAVSYGAKVIRAVQMARYAMVFLTTASMIKSGDAKPEDVAYLSNILTKTVNVTSAGSDGKDVTTTTKAATDSYGFRYAAYGDAGRLSTSATQYLAGGGLGGSMSGVLGAVSKAIPGSASDIRSTCKFIQNPFVQGGSFIAGVALMLLPGGQIAIGAKDIAQGVLFAAVSVSMAVLPGMLKDLVAGVLVDNNTFGEEAGDAIVSGSGSLLSTLAGEGGNAPLKPEDAVAYINVQNKVLAQYAEADRLAYSPLDPSSPNTFMGKVVTQLLPFSSQMSSISSAFTTSASIVTRSLTSMITPQALATASASDFTQCQDYDYREIGLATDPFCNPIRGVPPQYLGIDPDDLAAQFIGDGTIDEVTGQPRSDTDTGKSYSKFISNCIDRQQPFGYTGQDSDENDGKDCFIDNQAKANYYINYIDQRIIDSMDAGYDDGSSGSSTGSATDMSNWPTADAINARIAKSEAATGHSSPLHGMGSSFIELGKKYGINPGIIVAILQRESQLGADGSELPTKYNNFGGNTAGTNGSSPGPCGFGFYIDRDWKKYCTPAQGLEGVFQNLDSKVYRDTDGTMANIMELYSPKFENDWTDMWNIFHAVATDLSIRIELDTKIYSSGLNSGVDNPGGANGSIGFSTIWKGRTAPTLYAFGEDSGNGLYGYGSEYGLNPDGRQHTGTDVTGTLGDPIYTPVSGTVTCSGTGKGTGTKNEGCSAFNDYFGQGNGRIEIALDNGDALIFGHTSTSTVQLGQRVTAGQQIGTMGGMNSIHTHVEYRTPDSDPALIHGWRIVDPIQYLGGG